MRNYTLVILQKLIAALTLIGIASLFLLCITIPFMRMAEMNSSSPCGMNHATELCPMTVSEHLGLWQKIVISPASSLSLLSLLITLAVILVSLKDTAVLVTMHRLRFLYHNYLQQQFSQGILHPKIY